jgi:hypothetical protein
MWEKVMNQTFHTYGEAPNKYKGLEMVTQNVAIATSHQVKSPAVAEYTGARYSIPFFQTIRQDMKLTDVLLKCKSNSGVIFPAHHVASSSCGYFGYEGRSRNSWPVRL